MSKKVEKNGKCPCGSGKKHKKCCLGIGRTFSDSDSSERSPTIFSSYNSIDLIKKFSTLTLLPENHGKNVRLEELTRLAILNFGKQTKIVPHDEFESYLSKNYAYHSLGGIPINLFTELITFHGGDYLIFPGITESGNLVLSNLLSAIYNWPDTEIAKEFKSNCKHATLLILNLSNIIAQRLGYRRYMKGIAKDQEALSVPTNTNLTALQNTLTFSKEEIEDLMKRNGITPEVLEFFLIDIDDPALQNEYLQESPLIVKPILFFKDEYIVLSPAALSYALTLFILSHADLWHSRLEVNNAYHDIVWNSSKMYLSHLGFGVIESPDVKSIISPKTREGVYRFDDDKLAYIQYISDSDSDHHSRKQQVINEILALPEFSDYEFMDITLVSFLMNEMTVFFHRTKNSRSLGMTFHDLDTLAKLKEHKALDLWKFMISREEQLFDNLVSFLDIFKVYKEHNDSFYLSDEHAKIIIPIEPGSAVDLYQKAKLMSDEHSATSFYGEKQMKVPVIKKDDYAPVYYAQSDLRIRPRFLVNGFFQPIWVTPTKTYKEIPRESTWLYIEMTDAIAYWLWQCQDSIKEYLESLGDTPLTVSFDFNPEESFNPIERNYERDPAFSEHFNANVIDDFKINISIPSSIIPYLYGADNAGERILLKQLLLAFNQLLSLHKKPVIHSERIEEIIETAAPLGVKKKIFILDSSNNLLIDPSNLEEHRYIEDYDVGVVLNNIVPDLGDRCPPVGDVTSKQDKTTLTRNIVMRVLLPKLSLTINQYDHEALLKRLIGLNESLIRKKEDLKLKTPTRIACFVSIEEQRTDLRKNLSKLYQTIIAVRCLIEHLAAQPSTGNKIVSTTGIDELIALESQIITWGSLGDQIEYDLFDVNISILPSGRIGTEKTLYKEIFDPYYASKSKENVQNAIDTFDQYFPQHLELDIKNPPEYLEKAFLSEFGLTFTRICEFIGDLVSIAYKQSTPFASLLKSELPTEINKYDHTYSKEEINKGLEYLCLFERGEVKNIPEGFDSIDISPWRFNRRLSLLRKPLVAVPNNDAPKDPTIYWGFRQLLTSRIYLFDQCMTNRLRVTESGPVQKALGKLTQANGKDLVKSVLQELENDQLIIDSEVQINTKSQLKSDKNIGDVDVLVIDKFSRIIYSLECKSMAPSRNIKEMVEEVNKLFGSDSKKGWIDKHVKRDEWLKENLDQLGAKYNMDLSQYTVKSFFVTQEDMLTPYLTTKHLKIPFVSLPNLKEKKLDALK